ncbi:MAG: sigma factor-like helix-turn-helix DNA-binding protein [Candidatus Hodarchaeales archaeon]
MPIQTNCQFDDSKEALFERVLKSISVQAFDALLITGVRDLDGFLCLTGECLRQVGITPNIVIELMEIHQQVVNLTESMQVKKNDPILENTSKEEINTVNKKKWVRNPDLNSTPIPADLLENLSKRAQTIFLRERIQYCEQLLGYGDMELFAIRHAGKKTVSEIKLLQEKITLQHQLYHQEKASLRCVEKTVYDPADWSLLSSTLPQLFRASYPFHNPLFDVPMLTIHDLGIPSTDIDKFRRILLFPEDPAEFLFSISVGYFIQAGISDETFSILLNHLACITGFRGCVKEFLATANISDKYIYNDVNTEIFGGIQLPPFSCPIYLTKSDSETLDVTWGEVAAINERSIIDKLGFTIQAFEVIHNIWQLKKDAWEIENSLLGGVPPEAYRSFQGMIDAYVSLVVKNERYHFIIKGRLGCLEGGKQSLEELGQHIGLTRERVRQVEKKFMAALKRPKIVGSLPLFWLYINMKLTISGGVCFVSEIAEYLRVQLKWSTPPPEKAIASLIALSSDYEIIWDPPICIIKPNHKCVNCKDIRSELTKLVENQENGMLSFEAAITEMHKFCKLQACDKSHEVSSFSNGYLYFLNDSVEEIFADENAFYTKYAWAQTHNKWRLLLVETVVQKAGRPMHFTEVHEEVNKDRPIHEQLSERIIYANIERSTDLLLWDRGTFIHRDNFSMPHDLIMNIENDIILRLKKDKIPYLSVSGIFNLYRDNLVALDVPSESALYSCLRQSGNKKLNFLKYPYILKNGAKYTPIPLMLESFVLNHEGVVTYNELKDLAIETYCLNEAMFSIYISKIPNLLRVNRGEYVHLDQVEINENKLELILNHLRKLLENYLHISVEKLFDEKKITCKLCGISTPIFLYSLMQYFFPEQFDFARYPQIRKVSETNEKNKLVSVSSEVINYIREKGIPCSLAELSQHFVDELGYDNFNIYSLRDRYKNILRYSDGVIVDIEILKWTKTKQVVLEGLADIHLDNRKSAGKPFGLISHLYDYMFEHLPELPSHIPWTPTIIGELLLHEGKYRILGTQRNAFVLVPNSDSIVNLSDLLYYILDTNYDGAANIDHFIADMREAGILKKSLNSMMLGQNSQVVIDGNVIQLAGLNERAERT